jgi:hypothetical protein
MYRGFKTDFGVLPNLAFFSLTFLAAPMVNLIKHSFIFQVFAVLMNQALSDSYRRDLASSAEWQQKYVDHMSEQHPHH